jgi:6-phosphofructokinase 1
MTVEEGATDEFGHERLGGIGNAIGPQIEARTGYETRVTILGHVLRGGTPTAFDRILATRFGLEAIDAAHEHDFATMVALHGTDIVRVPIADAVRELKTVPATLLDSAAVFFA